MIPDSKNDSLSDPHWQPLGQAMLDYFHGEKHAAIIVKSNVEPDREVPLGIFFREGQIPKLEKYALRYCYGRTLDAGAGTGVHALMLQKNGVDVTAMDISEEACQLMRERGLRKVVCEDLLKLGQATYDTILMLMNGIGLARDLQGLDWLISHFAKLLRSGGQVICDSTDISYVTPESRMVASVKPRINPDYYGVVWYQLRYKGREGEPYPWLFVDKDTLAWYAQKHHFKMEILAEQKEQYLARLLKTADVK